MNELVSRSIHCPYCGEAIEILIDCSVPRQQYIEDCQVCCRPINFDVTVSGDNQLLITVTDENQS